MNISLNNILRYKKYIKIINKIMLRKPLVVFRILNNYVRIIVLRQRVVRKVEIGVTFDCQCNCAKCSSALMRNAARDKITLQEIGQIASYILGLGAVQINLTGGEPLLHKNIFEIIKYFQPHKTVITINTNGLLLTEEMVDRLEKSGIDIIKISIDSPLEDEHDKSRAYKGCFKQAIRALAYIQKKKGVLGQISTVCIKENLNSYRIWRLVEIAKKYNALLGLTIPAASGWWLGNEKILLEEEDKKVLRQLIKIPNVIRDTDEAYLRSHCPAGSEEFYLTCYGDVIPCPLIQISFGNVKEESLKTIWKRMSDFEEFKNKKSSGCLAGENQDFIKKYLLPLKNFKYLPISIKNYSQRNEEVELRVSNVTQNH